MAMILSSKCERRRTGAAPSPRYLLEERGKSSKSAGLRAGKIIPLLSGRVRNECNHSPRVTVSAAKPTEERVMYIGLGGLLILILILWLLGVI
jgi:hypothetical protein